MNLSDIPDEEIVPIEAMVPMILNGRLADEIRNLLEQANRVDDMRAKHELLSAVEELAKTAIVRQFRFRQVDPTEEFDRICDECPQTDDAKRQRGIIYDEPRLWPRVVRASMIDPTPDDSFDGFWAKLSKGQRTQLFDGAWRVNQEPVTVPFVEAVSRITETSRLTSPTRQAMESLSASSADGDADPSPATTTTSTGGSRTQPRRTTRSGRRGTKP